MSDADVMASLNMSDNDWDALPDAIRAALVKGAEDRRDLARALETAKVALDHGAREALKALQALADADPTLDAENHPLGLLADALIRARNEAAAVLVNAVGEG